MADEPVIAGDRQTFDDTRDDYLALKASQWMELRDGDWLTFPPSEEPPLAIGTKIVLEADWSMPFSEKELDAGMGKRGDLVEVPLYWIEITEIRRTRKFLWRLLYRASDLRPLWLKSGPPRPEGSRLKQRSWTPVEEHGLTGQLAAAMDPEAEIVTGEYLNVLDIGARLRRAERELENDPEARMERDLARVQSEMRELAKRAVKMGVDPMHALAPIARAIAEGHDDLKDAA